jgi:hypothetical protein
VARFTAFTNETRLYMLVKRGSERCMLSPPGVELELDVQHESGASHNCMQLRAILCRRTMHVSGSSSEWQPGRSRMFYAWTLLQSTPGGCCQQSTAGITTAVVSRAATAGTIGSSRLLPWCWALRSSASSGTTVAVGDPVTVLPWTVVFV